MDEKIYRFSREWAGRQLIFEKGKLANQALSSVRLQYGDTVVLATVARAKQLNKDIDYFPLMVDYEEKLYAAGKIKGSRFIKREGRPTDEAILHGRMIDRAIRPLFNERDRREIQVILSILSVDHENIPSVLALLAASFALYLSPLDWQGPLGGVRIGRVNGQFVVNPTYAEKEEGDLDLIVAGTEEKVIMLEAGAKEVSEEAMLEAIELAKRQIKPIIDFMKEVKEQLPAAPKEKVEVASEEELKGKDILEEFLATHLERYLFDKTLGTKAKRKQQVENLKQAAEEYLKEKGLIEEEREALLKKIDSYVEKAVTAAILDRGQRVDGRGLDEIRPLSAEVGLLPRTHGSGLFNRGQTQVLSIATLGAPGEEQYLDSMEESGTKRYMHHYNFPPFSVGETGFMRGPGRREIGHGALAEKALLPVLPSKESFPYTIRVVSEVLSSNGSSSMGAVCGSSLALMDAGVPLKKAVAGIAMGLASENNLARWRVLTDLQDLEDGEGGMDFKVAGTKDGITAIQLDTKTLGLTKEIVEETLKRARLARLQILEVMSRAISAPREHLSPYAPRVISFKINPDKIRDVIGPGGKVINEIISETGVTIDIEDDGSVFVSSPSKESLQKAVDWIKNLTREVQVGEVFQGKVSRIMDFGAFVEILPNQEGLVHISELAYGHTKRVEDVVKVGDIIPVKVIEIDKMGRINLSLKAALPKPQSKFTSKFPAGKNSKDNKFSAKKH